MSDSNAGENENNTVLEHGLTNPHERVGEEAEPVFENPVDESVYENHNLAKVLNKSKNDKGTGSLARGAVVNESSTVHEIKNIEKVLNFEEDALDFAMVEKIMRDNLEAAATTSEEGNNDAPKPINKRKGDVWAVTDSLPKGEFEKIRNNMAITYPFELDTFQMQAVTRLERRENVFVAAHTSAGKTVVAEYGIALSLKNNTRSVYTSPIKALSNQKYRDFRDKFGVDNVGIITGDVSVNPNAQCLIMTTEIFRSMLYKGADTIRDIEFVIFDEVHYVNDSERGVVWEEVIIMLPDHVTLIFLSATTPNAHEFSEWIGRTKRKKVFVITTNKRPVPLQHFLFHDLEMFPLMSAEKPYSQGTLGGIVKFMKEKSKPKPMTADNAKMQSDRLNEKAAIAAQKAGKNVADQRKVMNAVQQKQQQMHGRGGQGGRGGGGQGGRGGGGGGGGGRGDTGGKGQWVSLLKILHAGGREAAGGLREINFGVPTNSKVLSKKGREEKNQMVKYEKLPAELRAKMSKSEYESTQFRGDENEADDSVTEGGLLPVVIFSFSKKRCEEIADYFKGQDLLTAREKGKVAMMINQVVSRLNPMDCELPQINRLKDMLCRGIGVHHGGLLPILKETVEILFSQSIVKVLMATETFAMGVNMPARSVVFNGFRKHDGKSFRDLLPGEYIQMAGRAGRRGLDAVGTVIVCAWNELPQEHQLSKLLTGSATRLSSQFRLRYNMILNLVRVNTLSVEEMIKRSFTEYHTQRALAVSNLADKAAKYEALVDYLTAENQRDMEAITAFQDVLERYVTSFEAMQSFTLAQFGFLLNNPNKVRRQENMSAMLCAGRVIYADSDVLGCPTVGMIVSQVMVAPKKPPSDVASMRAALLQTTQPAAAASAADENINDIGSATQFWVLFPIAAENRSLLLQQRIPSEAYIPMDLEEFYGVCEESAANHYLLTKISLSAIGTITRHIMPCYSNVTPAPPPLPAAAANATGNKGKAVPLPAPPAPVHTNPLHGCNIYTLCEGLNLTNAELDSSHIFDITKDLRLNDFDVADRHSKLMSAFQSILAMMRESYDLIPQLAVRYNRIQKIKRTTRKIDALNHYMSDQSLSLFPDFQQRLKILGLLGYVDEECKVITQKGRAACALNACDELLGTEILFNNVLEPLNPPEAVAMLSALVFQEKNEVEEPLTTRMEEARVQMQVIFDNLMTLQELEGVQIDVDCKPILNFGLCGVVYQWARGVPFGEITKLTEFQEGSIVRAITRLDELCRDVRGAAQVIGNQSLYRKMEAASQCIKRDIVFAASLYIV